MLSKKNFGNLPLQHVSDRINNFYLMLAEIFNKFLAFRIAI